MKKPTGGSRLKKEKVMSGKVPYSERKPYIPVHTAEVDIWKRVRNAQIDAVTGGARVFKGTQKEVEAELAKLVKEIGNLYGKRYCPELKKMESLLDPRDNKTIRYELWLMPDQEEQRIMDAVKAKAQAQRHELLLFEKALRCGDIPFPSLIEGEKANEQVENLKKE